MRVVIVDDEAPARARLARLLRAHPGVEIVGEAGDAAAALDLVARLGPDVLLLDVQMPEVDGFDVAASLPADGPAVVFVTAHDRYALRAFDAAAVDYLLKPVEPERLARALQRLRMKPAVTADAAQSVGGPPATRVSGARGASSASGVPANSAMPAGSADPPAPAATSPRLPRHLLVPERGGTRLVRCDEIEWLAAADNYVDLHLADGATLLLRRPFAALLADLGPGFVRTHRSAAVATDAVRAWRPRGNGDATIALASGAEVPCSRAHRAALVARLVPAAGGGIEGGSGSGDGSGGSSDRLT